MPSQMAAEIQPMTGVSLRMTSGFAWRRS